MSPLRFLVLLFLLPVVTQAQIIISGKVTTSVSQTGIGNVSVFLSNSSYGTETAEDGSFKLVGVKPGQYDLVASSVGYAEYTESIQVGKEPMTLSIKLAPKVNQLRGVVIQSAADWKKNFEQFKNEFIGASENAKKCEIENPHSINLEYHGKKRELDAWSESFLVVDNKALGYRVKFLVDSFSSSALTNIIAWQGKAVFQELPGREAQKKIWKQKREETYYGSSRHFFRSLYADKLTQEGFIMRRLSRQRNSNRPDEGIILQKLKKFRESFNRDSFNYWVGMQRMSKYMNENLSKEPLHSYQVFSKTNKPGLFVLSFTDCLYIIYTKKHEENDFKDLYRPLDMENFETSVLTLTAPYAVFDMNGVVFQGAPLNEGTWSKAKLAELLPFDYTPDEHKETN